jgi:hypothetical protein
MCAGVCVCVCVGVGVGVGERMDCMCVLCVCVCVCFKKKIRKLSAKMAGFAQNNNVYIKNGRVCSTNRKGLCHPGEARVERRHQGQAKKKKK